MTDESGKINPNSFVRLDPTGETLYNALMKLPNVTDDLAAPIVDWVDADDTARQNGAESDYYSGMTPSYRCKNGPLDSIDELLLVKGINRDILYGNDLNVNGIQDANETVNTDGFSRGLAAFLTVHSREQNINPQTGLALTYINGSDLNALFETLAPNVGDDLAKFIIMYEQYGPSNSTGQTQSLANSLKAVVKAAQGGGKGGGQGGGGGSTPPTVQGNLGSWSPDFTKKASQKISSFFDLVNAQVSIAGKDPKKDPTVIYKSPLSDAGARRELLPKLFQYATIFQESDLPARVNVNTAPQAVLAALPEFADSDVQTIVSVRPKLGLDQAPDPIFDTPAWLLTEAKLKTDTLKKLEKYITTKTQVYRVQSLGYFNGPGPTARVEAVIDTHSGRPRIIMWRDLTELGTSGMKNNQP
jgi:type II secretory pathway component PulK